MRTKQHKEYSSLFSIENLITQINTDQGLINAVDNVSLNIGEKEIFGLVGESGCGKTITAKSILQILPKNAKIISGEIKLENINLLKSNKIKEIRGKVISMIFQEPMTSLNPVFTIGVQIEEILKAHFKNMPGSERKKKVLNILKQVGIPSPEIRLKNYPFELSGGMRQRAMIAMALVCGNPKLLIADEPTTALDVTVQAQILELVIELMRKREMGLIWITHDLGVVAELADWVAVMYAGHIVEYATVEQIFAAPRHPYTIGLLESMPSLEGRRSERLSVIPGQPPNLIFPSDGCPFADRCSYAFDKCSTTLPSLMEIGEDRQVACWWDVELDMERSVEDR